MSTILALLAWSATGLGSAAPRASAQPATPHALAAAGESARHTPQPGRGTGVQATAAQIADITEDYCGRMVRIQAQIDDVLGRQAFLLNKERPFSWQDLLVVAPLLARILRDNERVTVTGTVQTLLEARDVIASGRGGMS